MSLPQTKRYVEEDVSDMMELLHSFYAETKFGDYKSWLDPVHEEYPPYGEKGPSPYAFNFFSQWRKVHLCLELVKESGIAYSLVIRARPDHLLIRPFDLRQLAADYGARPSIKRARSVHCTVRGPCPHSGFSVDAELF
jgi:hypothetical protein